MVSIYVIHYNRLDLLEFQNSQLIKHCKDLYKYIVINNGKDNSIKSDISNFCTLNNIQEIKINENNAVHNTAMNHKTALQYCYDKYISSDTSDLRVVMDSDCIPYSDFSFKEIMGDKEIGGIKLGMGSSEYIASFISIFSNKVDLSNLNLGVDIEFDSGIFTQKLVEKHTTKWLDHTAPMRKEEGDYIFRNLTYDPSFGIQFIEKCFIHYYRGTGWDNGDINYIKRKHNFIFSLIQNIDKAEIFLDENVHYENAFMDQWINKEKYKLYVKLSNISN